MRTRLVAAAVVFAMVAVVISGSLAASAGARGTSGYGGLGATVRAFYAQNPHGSGFPPLGVAYYKVDRTKHGKVTAFEVAIHARPAFSPRERLALVSGIDLPADARETNLNSTYCLVLRSRRLGKLIGMQYAAATTSRWDTTTAHMRAERRPHC